ncbi:MAG: PucR family transcriptional regulator [Mycobacteriaceae bacterium]
MTVTVGWLARQSHLGLSVVAGAQHVDREIQWAHAIELADPAPYLSGGELVMTTGITVGIDPQAQFDYVARLVTADAAALAFDTGTNFTQVPGGIISAGDELGMPILRVPASTPFIAITRAVIDAINADQFAAVQRTVELQERLARETLRGGIPALVATLGRALSATVVAVSTDGRLLAGAGPEQQRVAGLAGELIGNAAKKSPASRVFADGDGYCTLQTLRAASIARGYLAVRSGRGLSSPDRLLVAHAVSLISIELEKPTQVLDAAQRLRIAVTQGLIAKPDSAEPTVLRYFGFESDTQVVAVVLAGVGPTLTAADHVHRILHRQGAPFLMCPWQEDLIVILPADHDGQITLLHKELRELLEPGLRAGLSTAGPIGEIEIMVAQARTAARARAAEPVRRFDRLGVFDAILSGRTTGELSALAEVLRPLEDHELVPTLTAFLEHNGHLESAAAALGVHRHTVRNRVGRIGEILGQDIDSADTRAQLLIAVRAREMAGLTASG